MGLADGLPFLAEGGMRVTLYPFLRNARNLRNEPGAGLFHDREEFTTPWSIKVFAIMVRARKASI
jgi:hypothetical protein